MKRLIKWKYFLLGLLVVMILFLLSSTNLIWKEDTSSIYTLSVILDEHSERYINFRKGINQAAGIENVDIHYETAYEMDGTVDYERVARQAVKDEVDAILILAPVDEEQNQWIREINMFVPVVLMGNARNKNTDYGKIAVDYVKMGTDIAQWITNARKDSRVLNLYAVQWDNPNLNACKEAVISILKEKGWNYHIFRTPPKQGDVLTMDTRAMERMLERNTENVTLYGIGYNNLLSEALAEGRIKALALANEFDMGYLAVRFAVDVLEGEREEHYMEQNSIVACPDDAYGKYQSVLFPMA